LQGAKSAQAFQTFAGKVMSLTTMRGNEGWSARVGSNLFLQILDKPEKSIKG